MKECNKTSYCEAKLEYVTRRIPQFWDIWVIFEVLEWYLRYSSGAWVISEVRIVLMMIIQGPPAWRRLQEAENKMHFILVAPFPQNCNHPHTACKCFSRNGHLFFYLYFCILCFCILYYLFLYLYFGRSECFSGIRFRFLCFWFLHYDDLYNEFSQSFCQKI